MQKDITKIDFAKNKTEFQAEFNAMRAEFIRELRNEAKAKGWVSYIRYIFTQERIIWN